MGENGPTEEFPDPLPADPYEKTPKSRKRPADRKQNNLKYNNTTTTNNNLHLKRVTQPMGYKVVEYIAFRYRDLKEGRDGAHLITSVKPFQTLGHA